MSVFKTDSVFFVRFLYASVNKTWSVLKTDLKNGGPKEASRGSLIGSKFLRTGLLGASHNLSSYEAIFDFSTDSESFKHSLYYGF